VYTKFLVRLVYHMLLLTLRGELRGIFWQGRDLNSAQTWTPTTISIRRSLDFFSCGLRVAYGAMPQVNNIASVARNFDIVLSTHISEWCRLPQARRRRLRLNRFLCYLSLQLRMYFNT
jgi:hypothetical protein